MTDHPSVLILGARGRLGHAAATAFARAGWRVWAQTRPGATGKWPAGVHPLPARLDDVETIARVAGDATVVVHALNPGRYGRQAWACEVPLLGDQALAIAQRLGALLMLPGNVYNFGRRLPAVLREDTPQPGDTHHGRVRVALEQRLQQAVERGGPRCVVVRAGDFYGAGSGSWLDQMILKGVNRARLTLPGDDDATPHAWAYLPDFAQALVQVAQRRQQLAPFETLHFGGHTVTGREWRDALDPTGQLKVARAPWALLRWAGLIAPDLAALHEMRYLWQRPHTLDNTRLTALIGPEPQTPFLEAARAAAQQLGHMATATAPALQPRTA